MSKFIEHNKVYHYDNQYGESNMSLQNINLLNSVISVKGKVFWNDQCRRIDIKKPIRDLLDNESEVSYIMELCLNKNQVVNRIKELQKQNIVPVILYFNSKVKNET